MTVWFGLVLVAYLLGSVPASYLAAKWSRGIDLRQYGTGQTGAGNLWRMTSWRLALPVGIFDLSKGLVVVWVAELVGLTVAQQIIVGLGAVSGHNWPVFLRFRGGGRGVGTAAGVILILPLINDHLTPWPAVASLSVLAVGSVLLRSSPLPVLAGVMVLPLVSWLYEPVTVTLSFLSLFLVMVVKRLIGLRAPDAASISTGRLLLNRLLFDRDIADRKAWMFRTPHGRSPAEPDRQRKESAQ